MTHTPPAEQQLDEIEARAAALYEYATVTDQEGQDALQELTDTDVPALLAALRDSRARVAELEGPAVEARAALAALCYDLEDPGSNAFGALYLISQATVGVEAPKDDAALALGQHASEVLHRVAAMADPEPPEVSFFGGMVGPQVAAWLRMLADQPARPAAVAAAGDTDEANA